MQRWEYFVAPLLEHNPGEILNAFGEDGWELVSVLQIENPMGGRSLSSTSVQAAAIPSICSMLPAGKSGRCQIAKPTKA